jgi:diacylglycerol kinase (ATP)
MQAELIYNAHAGHSVIRRELSFVTDYLRREGWTLAVHETDARLEATDLARQAAMRGADVVIAVGGDGTVNEVASGLLYTNTTLGVIPVGTTNVWALQMRIPALNPIAPGSRFARLVADVEERMDYTLPVSYFRSVLLAAARVLVEGTTHVVDVGQANDRHFLLWAGVGLDAAVIVSVSPETKKAFGPWATVGTALDMVRDYKSTDVRLTVDGQVRQVKTSLIVVSNIQIYGGFLPIGARACVDDGLLDVCVFKGEGLLNYVQHVISVASRQHLEDPQIEYCQCQQIVVESSKPLPVHVDDEPFTHTPVAMSVLPGALRVILPRDAPRQLFAETASQS